MLRQLAFASRARSGLKPADTSAIIASSRANNARAGVTGVLVYSGETFLGLVEGPDAAIAALWRRLLGDERHHAVASLYGAQADGRWFIDWRAGYLAESDLAPLVVRWRALAPAPPSAEVERLRVFLSDAEAF